MNIIANPFDPDWFQLISGPLLTEMMRDPFVDDITKWQNNANHFEYAEKLVAAHSNRCEQQLEALVLDFWFMIGNTDAVKKWLKKHPKKDSFIALTQEFSRRLRELANNAYG